MPSRFVPYNGRTRCWSNIFERLAAGGLPGPKTFIAVHEPERGSRRAVRTLRDVADRLEAAPALKLAEALMRMASALDELRPGADLVPPIAQPADSMQ